MLGAVVIIGVCLVGIAFNVRFLLALFREPKTPRVVYRMHMKLDSFEVPVPTVSTLRYKSKIAS